MNTLAVKPLSRLSSLIWQSELVQSLREIGTAILDALLDKLDNALKRPTTTFAFPQREQAVAYAQSVLDEAGLGCCDGVMAAWQQTERPVYYTPFCEPLERYYYIAAVVAETANGPVFGRLVVDKETLAFAGIQTKEGLITRDLIRA